MHGSRRRELRARGDDGKTAVVGARDRETGRVRARVVHETDEETLQGFATEHTRYGSTLYTDGAYVYRGVPRHHEFVIHSVGEYVREQAHTNGMESFWSQLKRGYVGVHHKISPKHLGRYVTEFAGRHNDRCSDTVEQMGALVRGIVGKRLRYSGI